MSTLERIEKPARARRRPRSPPRRDAAALEELRVALPRAQVRADDDPAGDRRARAERAGPGRQGRQRGPRRRSRARSRSASRALDGEALERSLAERVRSTSRCPACDRSAAGHLHLLTRTRREIEDVFVGLGYRVMEGPEIEHDFYNFTALNHPPGHPARRLQDTFYVDPASLAERARAGLPPGPQGRPAAHPHLADAGARDGVRSRRRSSSSSRARSTAATRSTRPTCRCSTRSRGSRSGRGISLADLAGTLEHAARALFGPEREDPPEAGLLPVHRAVGPGRRLLLCLRRDRRARRRRARPALQGHRLDRDPRRRDGRPERLRVRRFARLRPPDARRASPSGWGSSGSRCSSTGSRTCGCSSRTTSASWSSSDGGGAMKVPFSLADASTATRALARGGRRAALDARGRGRARRPHRGPVGGGVRRRPGARRRAAPERRPPAGLRGRRRRRRRRRSSAAPPTSPPARWVAVALPGARLPGRREAEEGEAPRRRVRRDDPLRARARALRRARRHHRPGPGGLGDLRRGLACRRNAARRGPADRRRRARARPQPEPRRLPRRLRRRPRGPRDHRGAARDAALGARRRAGGGGDGRAARLGPGRGPRALPAVHRPGLHGRHDRTLAAVAEGAACGRRPAADLQRRRHHQLRDAD